MAAIDFNELFTRIGKIGHVAYVLAGNQAAVPTLITNIFSEYENTTDLDLIGNLVSIEDSIPSPISQPPSILASLATTTLVRMVNASVPSISTLNASLVELIRQMKAGSQSVDTCTVAASAAALSTNIGTGTVLLTTKRGDGLVQENMFAEVLRLMVTADSYTGGTTQGQERLQLTGVAQTASNLWAYNYPTGSGASTSVSSISAAQDASAQGNTLTNGDMESWTTDSPPHLSNFVMSGTWGTEMLRSTTSFLGTYSLRIAAGNTANIYQEFGDGTAGTSVTPVPLTSYMVNFQARAVAGTVSAGVLTVELVDDSGTVINDQQGVANSFTKTLSTLTTAWSVVTGTFRIPEVPPTVMRLRLRVSTLIVGDDVLVDELTFTRPTAAYAGGFGFNVYRGVTPFVTGDGYDVTTTNNRSGESYLATFSALFDRLFGMRNLNLLLPSSGSPTQADTKITS